MEPVSGIPQGNYEPMVQLIAPTKLQMAVINGSYYPSEKTNIYFEAAGSKTISNLFSYLDDEDNDGLAGKLSIKQSIIKNDSLWNLEVLADATLIQENFKTIQTPEQKSRVQSRLESGTDQCITKRCWIWRSILAFHRN